MVSGHELDSARLSARYWEATTTTVPQKRELMIAPQKRPRKPDASSFWPNDNLMLPRGVLQLFQTGTGECQPFTFTQCWWQ